MIPYYERFMEKFPTVAALAAAPEPRSAEMLGRPGLLFAGAQFAGGCAEVLSRMAELCPDDHDAVAALNGVGPYTSGAIMSIAFNRPEPAVDGNVMRVLSRYFLLEDDIAKPADSSEYREAGGVADSRRRGRGFQPGVMELGALVCTPKSPGCLTCPVMMHCEGRMAGKEHSCPSRRKRSRLVRRCGSPRLSSAPASMPAKCS